MDLTGKNLRKTNTLHLHSSQIGQWELSASKMCIFQLVTTLFDSLYTKAIELKIIGYMNGTAAKMQEIKANSALGEYVSYPIHIVFKGFLCPK